MLIIKKNSSVPSDKISCLRSDNHPVHASQVHKDSSPSLYKELLPEENAANQSLQKMISMFI